MNKYEIEAMLDYLKSLAGKRKDVDFFVAPLIDIEDKVIIGFTDFAFDITFIGIDKNYLEHEVDNVYLLSSIDNLKNFKDYVISHNENTGKLSSLKELIYASIYCNDNTKNIPFFIDGDNLKNLNKVIKTKDASLNNFQYLEFNEDKKDNWLIVNAVYKDLLSNDIYKCEVLKTAYSYKEFDILNRKNIRLDRLYKEFKGSSLHINYINYKYKTQCKDIIIFSEFYKYGVVTRINILSDTSLYKDDYFDFNSYGYNIDDYVAFIKMNALQNVDNRIISNCLYSLNKHHKEKYKHKYILSTVTKDDKDAIIKIFDSKEDINEFLKNYTRESNIDFNSLNYDGYNEINNYYFITIKEFSY